MSSTTTTYSTSSFLDNQKSIDTVAGFASGGIAKLVEYPADTVKTRMQSGRFAQKSALQVIWDIVRNEGALKGFYRGVAMPLASCGAEVAVTFAIYNEVVNSLLHDHDDEDSYTSSRFSLMNTFSLSNLKRNRDEHAFKTVAVASAVAGVANGMLLTPLEVIKCRCQANPAKYPNVRECIKVSAREDGLRVFASGATGTFLREIPGTMAFFLSLETAINVFFPHYRVTQKEIDNNTNHLNSHLAPGDLRDDGTTPFYCKPIAGAFAGFGLMLLPYPIDTIKTLTQTSRQYRQLGFVGTGRDIFKKHGVRYFYRGLPITLMRAAPGNAIVFSSYDYFSNYLARKSEERKSVAHQIHFHRQQQQQQPTSGEFVVS